MKATCNGFLLDESKGTFKAENGKSIDYHSVRIYNTDENLVMKVKVTEDSNALPEPQVNCVIVLKVNAGEKFCKLVFHSCEL